MQDIIDRLKNIHTSVVIGSVDKPAMTREAVDQEFTAIIVQLENLDQEHRHQTDELTGLRFEKEEIREIVVEARRKHNIWEREVSDIGEDVSTLIVQLGNRLDAATDDATAQRAHLEIIRSTASRHVWDDGQEIKPTLILEWVQRAAIEGLGENGTGAALRKDIRQLEAMVKEFEEVARRNGNNVHYNDPTLYSRVKRVVDYYTELAANTVSNARAFKDDILTWLRAMAINAESVSWAGTHQEKNARLRGLVEVIERACKDVNELRVEERRRWNDDLSNWMRSDFPLREFKRRIYELEAEIKQLKAAQESTQTAEPDTADDRF